MHSFNEKTGIIILLLLLIYQTLFEQCMQYYAFCLNLENKVGNFKKGKTAKSNVCIKVEKDHLA